MAQAGFTPIQLYFSTTAAAVPTSGNLANGELAINIVDEKLYFKNSAGTVKLLASNATSAPVTTFSAGTTGFTPNTATSGAITLAGTLATTNGGTGLTSFTANGVVYASSTSALATGSALIFDGTNLGIGNTSPTSYNSAADNLVIGTSGNNGMTIVSGSTSSGYIMFADGTTGQQQYEGQITYDHTNNFMAFNTSGNERLRIDSSGNLGLGVTPSAWRSEFKVLQLNARTSIFGSADSTFLSTNEYIDSAGTARYIQTGSATRYRQDDRSHIWSYAASGTAGNAITFTQAMTLDASGRLLLGTTSASGAKMDLAFSTTQNGIVIAPTSFVYPTYSLISTNGVIGTVKSGSGSVNLIDIRAQEQTSTANGIVTGGYFQIDNPNAAVNVNGGQIGVYGLVNGVNNYTTGHQYGVYGRAGSGGTWGIGVMAVLGANVSLGYRAALVALTNNTTDRIASFQNSGGEYVQINGLGSVGIQYVPNRWFSNRSVIQMGSSVGAISAPNGYEIGLNFYVAETTAVDKRAQTGYANKMYSDSAVGDILWATAGTGAGDSNITWGEKMRLTNGGQFLVGTSAALQSAEKMAVLDTSGNNALIAKQEGGSSGWCAKFWNNATSGDNKFVEFTTETAITARGSITYNRAGGLTVYNTTSDYRAKEISGPVTNSGTLIDSVPVYMGKMKWATQERPMFIAHETPSYAHTGVKDAVDKDGNPVYQEMDASALIPVMWAEIQSLRKRLADAGI